MIGFVKSAPNARARFSCGKENNCLSEGLYTKERFCYDKENQQLQTKMPTENPGQTVVECGKAAGYIKMVGKKIIARFHAYSVDSTIESALRNRYK